MAIEIIVPAVGESIREATISRWFKATGDAVARDEPLFEIETDKITTEINAPQAGTLGTVLRKAGEVVKIGEVVALLEAEGSAKRQPDGESQEKAPTSEGAQGSLNAGSSASPKPAPAPSTNRPLPPSVREAIRETGVNPNNITGTGPKGRLTKGDIISATMTPTAPVPKLPPQEPQREPPTQAPSDPREEIVPMTPLRRRIAARLVEAQSNAAILTTFNEVDMSKVMDLRKKYQERFEKRHGIKLGFMSFFVKASVEALQQFPTVNAEIRGNDIVYKKYYDIGVAVGGGKGLVVPIIRNANTLSFAQIEQTINEFGKKAKENRLTLQDLQGGTFTISNGGIYGSLLSTPILNPPQTGILGMHKIEERAVVIEGQIVARPMMYLALSYDHRLIDGREAVQFLVRIKECLEDPERLLLEV